MKLLQLTCIDDVHVPGTQHIQRYFDAKKHEVELKPDAIGVRICKGDVFTFVPWSNVVDAAGTEEKRK